MNVLEIMKNRRTFLLKELGKRYISPERKADIISRVSELENLIYIISQTEGSDND